tara:strand:- start:19149 stop:20018 length:870 start_codon:yes stop_codon:yes gene_type:complete
MNDRFLYYHKPGSKRDNILVSICILSYNSISYIKRLIECLLNQTDYRFEIIISDDCSIDNTVLFAKNLILESKDLPNGGIKIYKARKNFGIVNNSKFLLEESAGKYFKLLAADDMIAPNYVEVLLGHDNCNTDIFISDLKFIKNKKIKNIPERKKIFFQFLDLKREEQINMLATINILNASSVCVKRECLEKINAYSYYPVRNIEDWETWFRLWRKGFSYKFSKKTFSYYEISNPSSVDHSFNFSKVKDKFFLCLRFIKLNNKNPKIIFKLIINFLRLIKLIILKSLNS